MKYIKYSEFRKQCQTQQPEVTTSKPYILIAAY